MITIISGSNRDDNNTKRVALEYQRLLSEKSIPARIFSLDEINSTLRNDSFIRSENELLIPTERFIIIMPEYNGSYPGILKLMMDNTDIKKVWWYKKVLLTGVSTGRAGNLRGMEHLTGVLLHMRMQVHYNRLPISVVDKLMDETGHFRDIPTLNAINIQLDEFIKY
jgi:NAD(P)H-dependent FMN reductase